MLNYFDSVEVVESWVGSNPVRVQDPVRVRKPDRVHDPDRVILRY